MIEEIIISLQDKFRSVDFIDNEQALDKLLSLLQSQTSDKQKGLSPLFYPCLIE